MKEDIFFSSEVESRESGVESGKKKFLTPDSRLSTYIIKDFALIAYSHSIHPVEITIPNGYRQPVRWLH